MHTEVKGLKAVSLAALVDIVKDSNVKAALAHAQAQDPGRVAHIVGDSLLTENEELFTATLAAATEQAVMDPDLPVCAIFNGRVLKAFSALDTAVEARKDGHFPHVHVHIMAVAFF